VTLHQHRGRRIRTIRSQ